jgi:hypothetical protein
MEGLGEAVTGGMLARAVEPAAGEHDAGEPGNCLNCGAALQGAYCHQCGQQGHIHRTLMAFWHDLAHGVLHFEGKIWRTLPMLAWRPGELTRRYIDGERARFVSPMALFLFSVFLMFGVFGTIGGPFGSANTLQASSEAARDIQRETGALDARIAGLEEQRTALVAAGRPANAVEAQLAALRNERQAIATAQHLAAPAAPAAPVAPAAGSGRGGRVVTNWSDLNVDTPWPWLNHAVEHVQENPSLFAYKLQSSAYKFSWALIPISVPFVWLLFAWRRRFKVYDHIIFVTYSIAFMTMLMVVLSLIRATIGGGLNDLAVIVVPPIHMYRQLKGAYGLRRAGALWRTAALLLFSFVAALLFFALLIALGLLG